MLLVVLGLTFGNLLHFYRRSLTPFGRRFPYEFEESLSVVVNTAFLPFDLFLQIDR